MSSECEYPSLSQPVAEWQPRLLQHLHFVQSLDPLQGGGLGLAAFELHESFLKRNLPSLLVSTTGETSTSLLPHTREYPRRGPANAFYSPVLAREADQLLADADVLHGHGFYVSPNWILGTRGSRRGIPLVYHAHGFFEPWILQRSRWKKKLAHLLFENQNFACARLWRALTNKEADQIRAQGIAAPIVVAPNGIRLERFDNVPFSPVRKERRRLLFLGRLHPKKGIDLLLRAWSCLAPRHPDWELMIAGPDENGYLATLQSLVRELNLEESVSFPGTVTGTEKVLLLKSADLFALTSRSEGFSVAILEAMACRLPVLLTEPCNFPELPAAGGGLECAADPEGVLKGLTEALSVSDQERRQRGEAARRLVQSRYTWAAVSKTILDACEQHCR